VKRALITGGNGFVASHLARALLDRGEAVTVLERAPRPFAALALEGTRAEVEVVEADLRDAERVAAAVAAARPDVVFHLGGVGVVGPALADPAGAFETNVAGTWTLLEACRATDVPALVVASSGRAYGAANPLPYREEMAPRPASPYEASRAAADAIALSYWPAFGLPVAVVRFSNVYGGGDANFSRLVPEAVAAVLDGRPPRLRTDGSPERDFLFVADAVSAFLAVEQALAGAASAAGEVFNAGGQRTYAVAEVLETIAAVSGSGLEPEFVGPGSPTDVVDRQLLDSTKLRERTGWEPLVGLREGLTRTLAWYREHPELRPD
jgi:CDP-glucose 4,6-dehydratase